MKVLGLINDYFQLMNWYQSDEDLVRQGIVLEELLSFILYLIENWIKSPHVSFNKTVSVVNVRFYKPDKLINQLFYHLEIHLPPTLSEYMVE